MTFTGAVAFGIEERFSSLPILNLPANTVKVRRRIRANFYPVAFVKTSNGTIAGYILEPCAEGMHLEDFPSIGVNKIELP